MVHWNQIKNQKQSTVIFMQEDQIERSQQKFAEIWEDEKHEEETTTTLQSGDREWETLIKKNQDRIQEMISPAEEEEELNNRLFRRR